MTTLYESDIEAVVKELQASGVAEIEAIWNYSGRGMYGATCLGFIVPSTHAFVFRLGRLLGTDNIDVTVADAFADSRMCSDQMGLDYIVYFPDIEVVTDER